MKDNSMKMINKYVNVSYIYDDSHKATSTKTDRYEVDMSQEELDILVAITGSVVGTGKVRKLTDSIYECLEKSATCYYESIYEQKSMKDYFIQEEIISLPDAPKERTSILSVENHNIKVTFDENNKPTKVELV